MLPYCFVLLTPIVIAFEISHISHTSYKSGGSYASNVNQNPSWNPNLIGLVAQNESLRNGVLPNTDDIIVPVGIPNVNVKSNPADTYKSGSATYSGNTDDLIYLEMGPVAITDVRNQMNGIRNDVNDFIELIPAKEVQKVIGNYHHSDNEVQRAYAYLHSKDFMALKEKILNIQEVNNFLRYLNRTGLDVIDLMNTLKQLMGDPEASSRTLENGSRNQTVTGGLHGLVDDVLDILPQDQMLSLFFEKLDTNEEFAKFIHILGTEAFSEILQDIEDSEELQNFIYILHNNGIYVGKIVDSLKDFFFLGAL